MNIPPCLMRLKIINSEHHINLWLPLFLAWIILGALALVLSPLVAVLVVVLWPLGWGEFLLLLGPYVYKCVCSTRGLSVNVNNRSEVVRIYFV
ncbi:MAG: hypothetical protein JXA46_01320 [Dehalococcoidales bacterium]|nr:hypothetical protein [Dehalococcoidales bacterium]